MCDMAFWNARKRNKKKVALKRLPRKEKHKAWKSQRSEERDLNMTIRRRRQLEDMETKRMKKEKKDGKKAERGSGQ